MGLVKRPLEICSGEHVREAPGWRKNKWLLI